MSDIQDSYQHAKNLKDDFLSLYKNTHATHENYSKEINRLLFFLYEVKKSTLEKITVTEISEYFSFLSSPPAQYTGPKYPIGHEKWKPINKPLSPSSIKQARYNLNVFLQHLLNIDFINKNPIDLLPKKVHTNSTQSSQSIINVSRKRYFTKSILKKTIQAVDSLSASNAQDQTKRKIYDRYKFVLKFYYLTMVRISEFASLNTGSINSSDESGTKIWYLDVVGKGSKVRQIPISPTLQQVIEQYHMIPLHELSHKKNGHAYIPLIKPIRGRENINSKSLSTVVRSMYAEISDYIEFTLKDRQSADIVRTASSHWLRHTGGSHLLDSGVDIVKTRDILGHASVTTTNTYLHVDSSLDLHKAISNLKI